MREIKFRAWDEDKKQMERDIFYVQNDGTVYKHERHPDNDLESDESLVLMQYTGLKDKNGKEIYEKDIVACYDTSGELVYNHEIKIPEFFKEIWSETIWDEDKLEHTNTTKVKIIGNIYENPDLLK